MNIPENTDTAAKMKLTHIVGRQEVTRTKEAIENAWKNSEGARRAEHYRAFEALYEQSAMITRARTGEQMIAGLQDTTGRWSTQIEDSIRSGFRDIAQENTKPLEWFDAILHNVSKARDLYVSALGMESRKERKVIAKQIKSICRYFERLMQKVYSSGNAECAARIKVHLEWFSNLMKATWRGEEIVQPAPAY